MEQPTGETSEARDTIREFIKDGIKEQAFIAFHQDDLFLKLPGWVSSAAARIAAVLRVARFRQVLQEAGVRLSETTERDGGDNVS